MDRRCWMASSGLIPPLPTASGCAGYPSQLLGLVRSYEKTIKRQNRSQQQTHGTSGSDVDEEYDNEDIVQSIVDLMNHMIMVYSRHGLFQGDSDKAERILLSSSSTTADKKSNSRKNKSRGGLLGGGSGGMTAVGDLSSSLTALDPSNNVNTVEETLVFTAILRILHNANTNTSNRNGVEVAVETEIRHRYDDAGDRAVLISLVSELVVAMSQPLLLSSSEGRGRRGHHEMTCNVATYELLIQNGKSLLTGFINAMDWIAEHISHRQSSNRSNSTTTSTGSICRLSLIEALDDDLHITPMSSLLKATSLLVGLFGTKLSRSTSLVGNLRSLSWKMLTLPDDAIQDGAARLISSLPLAGGISGVTVTDRSTPSDIWTDNFTGSINGLRVVIDNVAPVGPTTKRNDNCGRQVGDSASSLRREWYGSIVIGEWLDEIHHKVKTEDHRMMCFNRFVRGLSRVIHFALRQDGVGSDFANGGSSTSSLSNAQINVPLVLSLVEFLVAFPLSAETVYFKTKRRLREVAIDGGLLNPITIAARAANYIKQIGHDILDSTLAVLGGPILLPYARRIIRISYASLLTSSSGPVRKAMDPTSAAQLDGKKRRWLHCSVPMRQMTIESLTNVLTAFGTDVSGVSRQRNSLRKKNNNSYATSSTDGEKAISLVVGCLIEEIGRMVDVSGYADDWASNTERTNLVLSCTSCLQASLSSFGAFLSTSCRSLIESTTLTGLAGICRSHPSPYDILSCHPVKVSFLQLASVCALIPWRDGASSLLVNDLVRAASHLRNDSEPSVVIAATNALCICDTMNVPRAPPLLYVSRAVASDDEVKDASAVLDAIQSAKEESAVIRKRIEEEQLMTKSKSKDSNTKKNENLHEQNTTKRKHIDPQHQKTDKTDSETKRSKMIARTVLDSISNDHKEERTAEEKNAVSMPSKSGSKVDPQGGQSHTFSLSTEEDNGSSSIIKPESGEMIDVSDKGSNVGVVHSPDREGSSMQKVDTKLAPNSSNHNPTQDKKHHSNGRDDDEEDCDDDKLPEIFDGGPDSEDGDDDE